MPDGPEHAGFGQRSVRQRGNSTTAQQDVDDAQVTQQPCRTVIGGQPTQLGERAAHPAELVIVQERHFQLLRNQRRTPRPGLTRHRPGQRLRDRFARVIASDGHQPQAGL
ncbi:MAG: hypothetical protein ACLP3Q_14195 [Streptosporangiaceae bacterium]